MASSHARGDGISDAPPVKESYVWYVASTSAVEDLTTLTLVNLTDYLDLE